MTWQIFSTGFIPNSHYIIPMPWPAPYVSWCAFFSWKVRVRNVQPQSVIVESSDRNLFINCAEILIQFNVFMWDFPVVWNTLTGIVPLHPEWDPDAPLHPLVDLPLYDLLSPSLSVPPLGIWWVMSSLKGWINFIRQSACAFLSTESIICGRGHKIPRVQPFERKYRELFYVRVLMHLYPAKMTLPDNIT